MNDVGGLGRLDGFREREWVIVFTVLFDDKDDDGLLVTELDTQDPELLEVVQRNWYYPFGMQMGGLGADILARPVPGQMHRYNGKELDGATGWYEFGARFQDPAIGRFSGVDRFAEKFPWQSPYAYAGNNPVSFIDVNGDSIKVNLGSKTSKDAFNAFFSTKQGRAFVGQYAAKGQTINGHTFESSGRYHLKGIDLAFSDRNFGKGRENNGAKTSGGAKGGTFINKRLKLGVEINTTSSSDFLQKVIDITHESFLHVQEYSLDFVDNEKIDYSHDSFYEKTTDMSPDMRHHKMFHNKKDAISQHPFAVQGYPLIISVNNQFKLNKSKTEIWNLMWDFWD